MLELIENSDDYGRWSKRKGDELIAALWLSLGAGLGTVTRKPYNATLENWDVPGADLHVLNAIVADLPDKQGVAWMLSTLRDNIANFDTRLTAADRERILDPVATVARDQLFFEAFSGDESSYGRAAR